LTSRLNHSGDHRYVTSKQVNDLVRRVAPYYTDEQITFMLNAKHLRTGRSNSFTTARVGYVRRALHLPPANPGSLPENDDPTWMNVDQAARTLRVSQDTIRRWAREGSLQAKQVMPQAPWRIHVTDEVIARMAPDARRLARADQGGEGAGEIQTNHPALGPFGQTEVSAGQVRLAQRAAHRT
jgi:excisionase family DNA binding protein